MINAVIFCINKGDFLSYDKNFIIDNSVASQTRLNRKPGGRPSDIIMLVVGKWCHGMLGILQSIFQLVKRSADCEISHDHNNNHNSWRMEIEENIFCFLAILKFALTEIFHSSASIYASNISNVICARKIKALTRFFSVLHNRLLLKYFSFINPW